jgi:hypothetical protein
MDVNAGASMQAHQCTMYSLNGIGAFCVFQMCCHSGAGILRKMSMLLHETIASAWHHLWVISTANK